METKVAAVAPPAPDPAKVQVEPRPRAKRAEAPVTTGPDPAQMRLVIERDHASGSYVYKTINRQTGEIVQQLPRAEVLKLRGGTDYAAGKVIKTRA